MAISKQPNGKWRADFNYKGFDNKRHRKVKVFSTKSEANIWLANQQVSNSGTKMQKSSMLFSDYFNDFTETHIKSGLKESTIKNWEYIRDNIIPKYFNNITLEQLNRNTYQTFINDYSIGRARSNVKLRHSVLKMVIQQAFHDGVIEIDPTYRVRLIGNDSKPADEKFLEADEFKRLIAYLTATDIIIKTKSSFIIYLIALSGMRIGEALALTIDDVDTVNKTISINKNQQRSGNVTSPKSKTSIRTIKMPDVFFENYQIYLSTVSGKELFPSTNISSYLNLKLHRLAEKLNFKNSISVHGLRHSHASFLIANGVDISYVSQRLGHANVSITLNIYAHLLQQLKVKEEQKTLEILG